MKGDTLLEALKRLSLAGQRFRIELTAAFVPYRVMLGIAQLDEFRTRARAVGIGQERAEAILQEEIDRVARMPDLGMLDALDAANRRLIEEAFNA